jgi:two-component system, cell cycle response regulator CpdR
MNPREIVATAIAPQDGVSPTSRIRILYVEDNPGIREMACELLAEDSRQIVALATAEDALNALGLGTFDILITDISLPGISGVELARRILKRTPILPVIIASGYCVDLAAYNLGRHVRAVTKPFEGREIDGLIKELIGSAHSAAQFQSAS